MSEYFINARLTAGPAQLNPISMWNNPDEAWMVTVRIDRGTDKPEYQHFYGSNEQDVQSKAELFVNALGNARVLQKIEDLITNEKAVQADTILNLIKTANRWN